VEAVNGGVDKELWGEVLTLVVSLCFLLCENVSKYIFY
jgi:hypothetical protein